MAVAVAWDLNSHCVLCPAMVCFLGMVLFFIIFLSPLCLKNAEAMKVLKIPMYKNNNKAFHYNETKSGGNENNYICK